MSIPTNLLKSFNGVIKININGTILDVKDVTTDMEFHYLPEEMEIKNGL